MKTLNTTDIIIQPVNAAIKTKDAAFEELYLQLRKQENRIYTDEQVALLPDIDPGHCHSKEWQIRKRSSQRLFRYLRAKGKTLEILEIGCGNGWLSAKLSGIASASVTGLDINSYEIEQAKRVFKKNTNLRFEQGNPFTGILNDEQFDIIIFAASIQYFSSLQRIIKKALSLLRLGGEIHIIDTNFYKESELKNARLRSKNYYEMIGHPCMAEYYFHHCIDELKAFNYKVIRYPDFLSGILFKNKNFFYWVCVQHP
ncbi:MAG TPA: class I SAM-dependent methyltransferase [Chitinophagaceae bacterium]|nr:class I SAM-dependent methyltransferase [Chitinophagaceae bacterium]